MGYTLTIGEAVVEYDETLVRIGAEEVFRDDAPAHGEPTDYTNSRWPSYSNWANAMRTLDLMDVMFNERNGGAGEFERDGTTYYPLMPTHPGEQPVTQAHVDEVAERLEAYKDKHPDHIAQYPPLKPDAKPMVEGSSFYDDDQYVDDAKYDAALVRGEWLLYWLKWAVENCKQPVFVNR